MPTVTEEMFAAINDAQFRAQSPTALDQARHNEEISRQLRPSVAVFSGDRERADARRAALIAAINEAPAALDELERIIDLLGS